MIKLTTVATWVKYYIVYVAIPLLILKRALTFIYVIIPTQTIKNMLAWAEINMGGFYQIYEAIRNPVTEQNLLQLSFIGKSVYFVAETISTILLLIALWYFLQILTIYKTDKSFAPGMNRLRAKTCLAMLAWALYQPLLTKIIPLIISSFKVS